MNLLHIAIKVRIQVHPLRISKQNILVKNESMTEKKVLSNIILLKSLPLILCVKQGSFTIVKIFHENPYLLNLWEYLLSVPLHVCYFLNRKFKKFDFRKNHKNRFFHNSVWTNDQSDHILRFSNEISHLEHPPHILRVLSSAHKINHICTMYTMLIKRGVLHEEFL